MYIHSHVKFYKERNITKQNLSIFDITEFHVHTKYTSENLSTITFILTTSANSSRNLTKFQYHFHLNYNVTIKKR